jgi:hypothetical protein
MKKEEIFTIVACSAMFTGVLMFLTNYNPIFGAYITIIASVSWIVGIATGYVKLTTEE